MSESAGRQADLLPEHGLDVTRFAVPAMDCPSCARTVEASVGALDGVENVDPRPFSEVVVVTYDGDALTRAEIAETLNSAGYRVEDSEEVSRSFRVHGMDCPSCATAVENALESVDGVSGYETEPMREMVTVTGDASATTVERAIESAGYPVEETADASLQRDRDAVWRSSRAIKTTLGGAVVAVGLLLEFVLPGLNPILVEGGGVQLADGLFLMGVILAGTVIFRNGYYSAINRTLDMDLLMSTAIAGAVIASLVFGESYYFEAATLAVLFGLAELLEDYSMDRARASLRELMDLSPDQATVKRGGETATVPVDQVAVGDVVVVRPGEKIPVDGEVREGESAVDQSPITGESVPVDKTPGDQVYAGTINEAGYIEIETTAAAGDTTLSRIVSLVEDAGAAKTDREQFVERFASYYTPVVVLFAGLIALVPPLVFGAPWPTFVVYGLTLLVLACPCAFVIATPVSVVSGITSAAKNGVLIKGGTHLESMGAVGAVALDKTGTLTTGDLAITDVVPLADNDEADVLNCASGVESRSAHPIGEAIVDRAAGKLSDREVDDFESLTGKGVTADLDGTTHYAGKPALFEELGFDLSHVHTTTDGGVVTEKSRQLCERNDCVDLLDETVPRLQSEGKTVVLVGTEDRIEGVIAVADEVRPEAAATVEVLQNRGIHVAMLTGDNERTARAIAESIGVDEFQAGLLPDEKVQAVERLDREYDGVAMVGDGVNDAPALATASVGIAMGAAGTDTALETADVALMDDDLSKLSYLYELAQRANGVIRQNVLSSLTVKAALALAVPFGYVPIWLAVLAGDAGMTVGVTGNALRLSWLRPD